MDTLSLWVIVTTAIAIIIGSYLIYSVKAGDRDGEKQR